MIACSFKFYSQFLGFNLNRKINKALYNSIFEKYLTVDYNFFVNNQQGNLIHTGTLAANSAATFIYHSIQAFSDFCRFLLLLSSLVFISWEGTFLIMGIGILYVLIVKTVMLRITYPYANKDAIATREKNVIFNELVSGIKSIKIR